MDKLIANASVGLARASINRRRFLGKVVGAAGSAVAISAFFVTGVSADHCQGSHFCETSRSTVPGFCGDRRCSFPKKPRMWRQEGNDCYTGATCPTLYSFRDCDANC